MRKSSIAGSSLLAAALLSFGGGVACDSSQSNVGSAAGTTGGHAGAGGSDKGGTVATGGTSATGGKSGGTDSATGGGIAAILDGGVGGGIDILVDASAPSGGECNATVLGDITFVETCAGTTTSPVQNGATPIPDGIYDAVSAVEYAIRCSLLEAGRESVEVSAGVVNLVSESKGKTSRSTARFSYSGVVGRIDLSLLCPLSGSASGPLRYSLTAEGFTLEIEGELATFKRRL